MHGPVGLLVGLATNVCCIASIGIIRVGVASVCFGDPGDSPVGDVSDVVGAVSGGSVLSGILRPSNLVARIWRDFSGSSTSISNVVFPLACWCLAWSKAGHLQNTW